MLGLTGPVREEVVRFFLQLIVLRNSDTTDAEKRRTWHSGTLW